VELLSVRLARRAIVALLALALAFALVTVAALELSDVARVETRTADGGTRSTHVWFAERDGALWVEAGTPENGWFVDVQRDDRVAIEIDGAPRSMRAVVVDDDGERARLRAALRERYGWRDAWVGLLVDASRSIPVRLEPAE